MSDQWGETGGSSWGAGEGWQTKRKIRGLISIAVILGALALTAAAAFAYTRWNNPAPVVATGETSSTAPESDPGEADGATAGAEITVVETAVAEPRRGQCDPSEVLDSQRPLVNKFCDGQWLLTGEEGTSFHHLFYWVGSEWSSYAPDGELPQSQMKCFDKSKLEQAGAPSGLISTMRDNQMFCKKEASSQPPASTVSGLQKGDWLPYPQCDGRYVVIVDSVSVYPGENPRDAVYRSLDAHPGAQSALPGFCDSLRASYDGATVYPIYVDFGNNRASACAAQARGAGYARKLQQVADYSSPC